MGACPDRRQYEPSYLAWLVAQATSDVVPDGDEHVAEILQLGSIADRLTVTWNDDRLFGRSRQICVGRRDHAVDAANTPAHTHASLRSEKFVYPNRNRLTRESIPPLIKLFSVIGWLQIDLASANAECSRLRHKSGRRVDRAGCADSDKKISFTQGGVDLVDLERHLAEPDDVRAEGACPSAG
jgi:hypothetical protein